MTPSAPLPNDASAAPCIDAKLVRGLLGMPANCTDAVLNEAVAQLLYDRKGVKQTGPVKSTFDETLFRAMLGIEPSRSADQVNADLRKFIADEALADADGDPADADAIVRKRLGIEPATWARYGDPAKPVALSAGAPRATRGAGASGSPRAVGKRAAAVLTICLHRNPPRRVAEVLAGYRAAKALPR